MVLKPDNLAVDIQLITVGKYKYEAEMDKHLGCNFNIVLNVSTHNKDQLTTDSKDRELNTINCHRRQEKTFKIQYIVIW